ncbi:MAG: hypothetical protein LKM43_01950 [Wolbachia endosymbiont of Penenirmus auritus]|nr:hypothetical protein [Wolbachia endosymbiont of Penenirmus auritus]
MNPGAANTDNFFNFKINHDVAVTGYPTRIWRATKKYSVNNTLPIVAVNAWLQFSLAYIAAVIVTSHDMSFIANILNSRAMPAYALASVILGTILLTSLVIKHVHKQEIKDEILKNGKNTIDIKIRGGESDGINEIAQNALTIEIVPDTSFIGDKKENFSIVLPISGKQGEILENKRQENRNKIVLLTVPYVLSGLTIVGALAKFGFANIQSWKQWTFIAAVGVIAIVGACVTLSKLRNNEVDNACNTVKRFDNADILLPCRKGSVVSVMENKFESKEKDDLQSQILGLVENSFLKPANAKVREVLDDVGENIKGNVDEAGKKADCLFKGIEKSVQEKLNAIDVNGTTGAVKNAAVALENAANKFNPSTWWSWSQSSTQPQETQENEQTTESDSGRSSPSENEDNTANPLESKVKEQRKRVKALELQKESNELTQREKDLEKELAEQRKINRKQEKTNERKEKINGKPSEFLYYVLESIKLEEKGDKEKDSKVEATLRNFNNKIIIHWKDGSQTICHIKKQGDLPSTEVDFVDKNIQAAFETACVG